jgi:membrane-bound acyltransferase YfiQ involved in biofilm formation
VPGLSITAIFYFSLGAYLAINRHNIVTLVHRYKYVILPVTILLYIVVCYYDGNNTSIGFNIVPFYCICGALSIFYIASELIMKYDAKPNKLLVSSCFFVYALHNIIVAYNPEAISMRALHFLIPGQSGIEDFICYFLTPLLTAAICVAVYAVCRKLFPRVTLIFSGNK